MSRGLLFMFAVCKIIQRGSVWQKVTVLPELRELHHAECCCSQCMFVANVCWLGHLKNSVRTNNVYSIPNTFHFIMERKALVHHS